MNPNIQKAVDESNQKKLIEELKQLRIQNHMLHLKNLEDNRSKAAPLPSVTAPLPSVTAPTDAMPSAPSFVNAPTDAMPNAPLFAIVNLCTDPNIQKLADEIKKLSEKEYDQLCKQRTLELKIIEDKLSEEAALRATAPTHAMPSVPGFLNPPSYTMSSWHPLVNAPPYAMPSVPQCLNAPPYAISSWRPFINGPINSTGIQNQEPTIEEIKRSRRSGVSFNFDVNEQFQFNINGDMVIVQDDKGQWYHFELTSNTKYLAGGRELTSSNEVTTSIILYKVILKTANGLSACRGDLIFTFKNFALSSDVFSEIFMLFCTNPKLQSPDDELDDYCEDFH